jgi:hypothetical protein
VTRGSTEKEVSSRAVGHVVALEPTSAGRCGPKLQLTWQRMDARPGPCLDLELVCGGTRSSGCRHVLTEQDPSLQCDNVFVQPTHFVGVCVDTKHDEQCQKSERKYCEFSSIPHPNGIEHI